MDLSQKNNLTPEETLRLRERLLSLESDEQAAQMLQLKYQIAQLEKQLSGLKASAVETSPLRVETNNRVTSTFSWQWVLLIALILIVVAFVLWRRRVQQRQAQEEPYSMLGISTIHVNPYGSPPVQRPITSFNSQFMPRTGGFTDEVGIPVRNMDDDWHDEDMDVVSPNSVAEEAQLLIDHGLIKQAINLLMHEVAERPTSLALWMKLFDVFQQNNMVELFQERAVAFRLQFSSEALWQQVQALGAQIDPSNPLYQSSDSLSNFGVIPESSSNEIKISNSNLADELYNDVGLSAKPIDSAKSNLMSDDELSFEIDFSPLQESQSIVEVADEEIIFASTPDSFELTEQAQTLVSPAAVNSTAQINAATPGKPIIDAGDFVSDDETLHGIANLISNGQRKEAFDALEILLYKGTMPQRLTASKWLDKLLSKYGKL